MSSHPTDDATDALARELAAKWTSIPAYDHAWQEMARFVQEREARACREAYRIGREHEYRDRDDMARCTHYSDRNIVRAKEAERCYPMPASERVPSDPPRPIKSLPDLPTVHNPDVIEDVSMIAARVNELIAAHNAALRDAQG